MRKCLICKDKFAEKVDLFDHYIKEHGSEFDPSWSGAQCHFFKNYGRVTGTCKTCKKETRWNSRTNRPEVFCDNPKCKEEFRKKFVKNMVKVHGKEHLLNDPEVQTKMLFNRGISGVYKWSDGKEIRYVGSYEKDFLQFLDKFMRMKSSDIMTPAPQIARYVHEGVERFYIPDVYIPSLNLVIEIKDGGDNPNTHPKIMAVDKVKEKLKDEAIKKLDVNYIKISNKEYGKYISYLNGMKMDDVYNGDILIEGVERYDNSGDFKNDCMLSESVDNNGVCSNHSNNISVYVFETIDTKYSGLGKIFLYTSEGKAYTLRLNDEFETAQPSEYENVTGVLYAVKRAVLKNVFEDVLFNALNPNGPLTNEEFITNVCNILARIDDYVNPVIGQTRGYAGDISKVIGILEPLGVMSSHNLNLVDFSKPEMPIPDSLLSQVIMAESIDNMIKQYIPTFNLSESLNKDFIETISESTKTKKKTNDDFNNPNYETKNVNIKDLKKLKQLDVKFNRHPNTRDYYNLVVNANKKNTLIIIEDLLIRDPKVHIDHKNEILTYMKDKYDSIDGGIIDEINSNVMPVSIKRELGLGSIGGVRGKSILNELDKEFDNTLDEFNKFTTGNTLNEFNINSLQESIDTNTSYNNINNYNDYMKCINEASTHLKEDINEDMRNRNIALYHGVII